MRLIDADALMDYTYNQKSRTIDCNDIARFPTAYDIDKVVAELEKTMQDLSVIEVLSHIDFNSTIQSRLDNFLKAYNSELLRIVKQGGVSDDVCEWKLNGVYLISPHPLVALSCITNYGYRYNYCPVCGKKIKAVE